MPKGDISLNYIQIHDRGELNAVDAAGTKVAPRNVS
jgi:hypothetical protein